MSNHLARDSALMNRLLHGFSREPSEAAKTSFGRDQKRPYYSKSEMDFSVEEKGIGAFPGYIDQEWNARKTHHKRKFAIVAAFFLSALITLMWRREFVLSNASSLSLDQLNSNSLMAYDAQGFAVGYPRVPNPKYGKAVHREVLINDTFASWGHPYLTQFTPPKNIDYNKVVLTMRTTVGAVQFDRLAHLYVGGAEIWRTSTIEPGGHARTSLARKDVSDYLSLFKEKTDILFQLDNLVNDKLKGVFHVQLHADFYYAEGHSSELNGTQEDYKIFSISKAADKVYPLVKQHSPSTPPLVYLPQGFSVTLPKVLTNTTRLTLSIFTSGNADEEDWYTNVLDSCSDSFKDQNFGHGPARFIDVFFNDKKIATQTPQVVFFTGAVSPALWYPVVATDAFDLKSIDLDVTGLLPHLWEASNSTEARTLTIQVNNGLDGLDGSHKKSGIGSNWITSANLLTYESKDVIESSGHVTSTTQSTSGFPLCIDNHSKGKLKQVVTTDSKATLDSNLIFKLKEGRILNTTVTLSTSGHLTNIQKHTQFGNKQNIAHMSESIKHISISKLHDDSSESLHSLKTIYSNPLALVISESEIESKNGNEILLDVAFASSKITDVDIDFERAIHVQSRQNGSSQFYLNPNGNHGTGSLRTSYSLHMNQPLGKYDYERTVDTKNGHIVSDHDLKSADNQQEHEISDLLALLRTAPKHSELRDSSNQYFDEFLPDSSFLNRHEESDIDAKPSNSKFKKVSVVGLLSQ